MFTKNIAGQKILREFDDILRIGKQLPHCVFIVSKRKPESALSYLTFATQSAMRRVFMLDDRLPAVMEQMGI